MITALNIHKGIGDSIKLLGLWTVYSSTENIFNAFLSQLFGRLVMYLLFNQQLFSMLL